MFLNTLQWALPLNWTCKAFKIDLIFYTLSKDYLKIGAIKGSSLN